MSIDFIQSSKFQGHQAPVLCLDIANDDSTLLSGSEDRTARLWDLRETRRRACLCIQTSGEVLSCSFNKTTTTLQETLSSSFTPAGQFSKDFTVYVSTENKVFEYDLRNVTRPIVTNPSRDLSSILQNQDEVNQISLGVMKQYNSNQGKKRKGGKNSKTIVSSSQPSIYLAAADDAGTTRIMEIGSTSSQVLHHDPNGVAVVTTCVFRPTLKGLELASGGTDCKVQLWDILKPKRPISSFVIQPQDNNDGQVQDKPQVCNPPMVHSLTWSPSGRLLAAGLGDGSCNVFSIENRSLVLMGQLTPGHDSSVASVIFPSFTPNNNERLLMSAGSDGAILCWDLGSNAVEGYNDPSSLFHANIILQHKNNMAENDNKNNITTQFDDMSLLNNNDSQPKVLFGLSHPEKPNWMVSRKSPASIYVGDTSNDITEYVFPMR